MKQTSFLQDTFIYILRIRDFKSVDWKVYWLWNGLMLGLLFAVTGFLLTGYFHGVQYPPYVWNIPVGIFIFVVAIGIDTIGHRTAYFAALQEGEALVHHITICAGVSSVLLLCLAYHFPEALRIPVWCLTGLSFFYSIIDEAMHWFRYKQGDSDRIEMWSHFFIFVGHSIQMVAWLYWFENGYPGVAQTLQALR